MVTASWAYSAAAGSLAKLYRPGPKLDAVEDNARSVTRLQSVQTNALNATMPIHAVQKEQTHSDRPVIDMGETDLLASPPKGKHGLSVPSRPFCWACGDWYDRKMFICDVLNLCVLNVFSDWRRHWHWQSNFERVGGAWLQGLLPCFHGTRRRNPGIHTVFVCQVVIASRNADKLKVAAEDLNTMTATKSVFAMPCNIRKEEEVCLCISLRFSYVSCCLRLQVTRLMQDTVKEHGRIDFLVNNGEHGSGVNIHHMTVLTSMLWCV